MTEKVSVYFILRGSGGGGRDWKNIVAKIFQGTEQGFRPLLSPKVMYIKHYQGQLQTTKPLLANFPIYEILASYSVSNKWYSKLFLIILFFWENIRSPCFDFKKIESKFDESLKIWTKWIYKFKKKKIQIPMDLRLCCKSFLCWLNYLLFIFRTGRALESKTMRQNNPNSYL